MNVAKWVSSTLLAFPFLELGSFVPLTATARFGRLWGSSWQNHSLVW
jgi:hypothetical protein